MRQEPISKEIIEAATKYCGGKSGLSIQLDRSVRTIELYTQNGKAPANIVREIRKLADRQRRKLVK